MLAFVVRLVLAVGFYVTGSQAVCWDNIEEMVRTGQYTQRPMSHIMRDFFANRTLQDMCLEKKAVDLWKYTYSFIKFKHNYQFSRLFMRPDKTVIWSLMGHMWPDVSDKYIHWQAVAEVPNTKRLKQDSGRIYVLYTDDDAKIIGYYSCWNDPEHNVEAVYISQQHGAAFSHPQALSYAKEAVEYILNTSGHSNVLLHCYNK